MNDKLFGYTMNEWVMALLDVLDGNSSPQNIHAQTGLPMDRCNELSKMFSAVTGSGETFQIAGGSSRDSEGGISS